VIDRKNRNVAESRVAETRS